MLEKLAISLEKNIPTRFFNIPHPPASPPLQNKQHIVVLRLILIFLLTVVSCFPLFLPRFNISLLHHSL